ncbi:YciI family protein [Alsobacter sp. SYSU BS001988]
MLFAVLLYDHPDRVHLRQKHVAEHLDYVAAQGNRVVAGGALRHHPDDAPHGALWLIDAETKEAARRIIEGDPFFRVGLRQTADVFHWSKGVWSEPFSRCIMTIEAE